MYGSKEVVVDLSSSEAYLNSINHWHELLVKSHVGQKSTEDPFIAYVKNRLIVQLETEVTGKAVLLQLAKAELDREEIIALLASALRGKSLSLTVHHASMGSRAKRIATSPFFLTSAICLSGLGSAHVYALKHGKEIGLAYLSPIVHGAVLFFVGPAIYGLLKKLRK